MVCLCEAASGCDLERRCIEGNCGPYKVTRNYWLDADNVTMYVDDYRRSGGIFKIICLFLFKFLEEICVYIYLYCVLAFEACANDYYCARRIVKNYLSKFGKVRFI